MSSAQKVLNVVLVLAVIAIGFIAMRPARDTSFGSFYESYPIQFGGGLQIGSTGNVVAKAIAGTCNASVASLPAAATTTFTGTCAVPNAATGDKVFVALPIGASVGYNGFTVHTSYVSSAGTIGFLMENLTGAATSSFPLATTSIQYWIVR